MELLSSQGLLNANPPLLTSPQPSTGPPASLSLSPSSLLPDFTSPPASVPISSSSLSPSDSWKRRNDSVRWKQPCTTSANALNLNLISATNQQKVSVPDFLKFLKLILCLWDFRWIFAKLNMGFQIILHWVINVIHFRPYFWNFLGKILFKEMGFSWVPIIWPKLKKTGRVLDHAYLYSS